MSDLGQSFELDCSFDAAIERISKELAAEGFGVVSRIDLDDVFSEGLGVHVRRFSILGACNAQLAHEAVVASPEVGLLLPFNLTVESVGTRTRVQIVDSNTLFSAGGLDDRPEIGGLIDDAGVRLERIGAALTKRVSH